MLKTPNNLLENHIVELLSSAPATADALQQQLAQTTAVSIQGIYRVLRKLQKNGVVIKNKHTYSLRIPWILDVEQLVEAMTTTYLQPQYISELLPQQQGEKKTWRYTNMFRMNDFWSQLLLAMAHAARRKTMLDYSPHAWFHLAQPEQESQYVKSLLHVLDTVYTIVGGNDFLDTYITQYWDFDAFVYYLTNKPAEHIDTSRRRYITVIDDLILTVVLPATVAQKIDAVFTHAQSDDALSAAAIMKILYEKNTVQLVVEKNLVKAEKHYNRFEKIFGVL